LLLNQTYLYVRFWETMFLMMVAFMMFMMLGRVDNLIRSVLGLVMMRFMMNFMSVVFLMFFPFLDLKI